MTDRQLVTLIGLGVLSYAALLLACSLFWWTTTLVLGAPLP